MTRRTGQSLNDLLGKKPLRVGSKIGTATVIAVSGMDGAARAARGKIEGKPWGRFVAGDSRRVVLAFSLPVRALWPNGPKGKWREKGKATKEAREIAHRAASDAMEAIGAAGWPWERAKASQEFWWPNLIRRDVRNAEAACKAVLDGIVEAGLLRDDSADVLDHAPSTFGVDRKNPRVELVLERCRR